MLKRIISFLYVFPVIVLLGNCAKMGSITGGLKDEDPPVVTGSSPGNYSTNFSGKRIEITFDEFITLNNVNQALVISPPLSGKPDIRLRGKTVQINLEGELRENTTYTLNFGNSIEDLNERNVLENYEFVFATGDNLDSLSIAGTILDAFTLKPSEEPLIIMAYDILDDSIPLKEIPVYIGRSDKSGNYRINNMKADTFKIFAIKDLNFNLLFDLSNELIAFADSFVYLFSDSLEWSEPEILPEDSIIINGEELTLSPDSIPLIDTTTLMAPVLEPYRVDLVFFEEDSRIQFLTDYERKEDKHLFLSFELPIDTFGLKGINFKQEDWFISETNALRDTFNIWVRDSELFSKDTLSLVLSYPGVDTLGNDIIKEDSIDFIFRKPKEVRGRADEEEKFEFKLRTIGNNSRLDFNGRIFIETGYPVLIEDLSKIFLFNIPDSVEVQEDFVFSRDSLTSRRFYIENKWKSKGKYRLFMEPGAFTDIYGNMSDTVNINFNVQDEEYYGVLFVTTSNVNTPLIVQLMNEKEDVLEEQYIETDQKVTFSFLRPARYKVKFIYDKNRNRKWDTGNYLNKRQPEKVEYYQGEINIRSNWELEIKWELRDPDPVIF